jgi:hypothetical protein
MSTAAMYLGMNKIRSAGRTSGSIEITLPPALQAFTGLGCRVVVRDGLQPEIVLQPDFVKTRSLLDELWRKLSLALGAPDLADDFTPGAFALTLLPPRHWQRGLPLAYADILCLARSSEEWTENDQEALARMLSVLTAAIGQGLGLQKTFAFAFGDAVAFVVTQVSAGFGTDFERSMAADFSREAQLSRPLAIAPLDEEFWLECEPALRRIYRQFLFWQENPAQYDKARQQWYRALQCESVPRCADSVRPPLSHHTRSPEHAD